MYSIEQDEFMKIFNKATPAEKRKIKRLLKESKIRKARNGNLVDYAEARNILIKNSRGGEHPLINDEYNYIRDILIEIEDFINDKNSKILVFNMPPRHAKTVSINRFLIPYLIGKDPTLRVANISYSEQLSMRSSMTVKTCITEPETSLDDPYISHADIFRQEKIKTDDDSKKIWSIEGQPQTTFTAASILGGNITGSGFDLIVIDDTLKGSLDATNINHTDKVNEVFTDTFFSRDGKILLVQTRWGENDLTDHISKLDTAPGLVKYITLKAYNEETKEMLNPYILNKQEFDNLQKIISPRIFLANYQQEEYVAEGYMYGDAVMYRELPETGLRLVVASFDPASGTGGDYTALTVATHVKRSRIPEDDGLYIQDVYLENDRQEQQMDEVASMLKRNEVKVLYIEMNHGGSFMLNALKDALKKINYYNIKIVEYYSTTNKFHTIEMLSPVVRKSVKWLESEHLKKAIKEYEGFKANEKGNRHDDLADTLTKLALDVVVKDPLSNSVPEYRLIKRSLGLIKEEEV